MVEKDFGNAPANDDLLPMMGTNTARFAPVIYQEYLTDARNVEIVAAAAAGPHQHPLINPQHPLLLSQHPHVEDRTSQILSPAKTTMTTMTRLPPG